MRLKSAGQAEGPSRVADACVDLLRSLAQSAKLASLYPAAHPVAAASLQGSLALLKRLQEESGWTDVTIAAADGRWIVNDAALAATAPGMDALFAAFRGWSLRSLTLLAGFHLDDLNAVCRLIGSFPVEHEQTHARSFLERQGARHVLVDGVELAARPSPTARACRPDPPSASVLLEGAARRLTRTEHVFSAVAEGKIVVDKDGRVLMMDPAAEAIAGKRLVEVAGKPILENLGERERIVSLAADVSVSKGAAAPDKIRMAGDAGALDALRQSLALVKNEDGHVVGTCAVLPAAAKYEETARLQREFISHVTHELKAPLTSICSALELVTGMTDSRTRPEERKLLDISLRNSWRLRRLVDEILDFSKLESGKMPVFLKPIPAGAILRDAVDGMRPWAASKKISLESDGDRLSESGWSVLADQQRIVQVLTNLISNAIKATPEGGRIEVSCRRDADPGGRAIFCVKDSGCGIARDDRKKIFQRFAQLEAGSRQWEGVGLGLAIVRQLIDLHAGSLWLESEPGKGAAFFFTLSLAGPALPRH